MVTQIKTIQKGLTVKDLVTTGIFAALTLVFSLIGGIFFAPNPVLTFYMPYGSALLCGPIYMLLVSKVQKRFSVTILGVIMGIVWFVTGMHLAMVIGYIIMGIIADIIGGVGQYKSKKINIISYMIFCLGATGSYIVYFINPKGWASTMLRNGTEQSYIDKMNESAPSWMLAIIIVGTLIIAALSAWFGSKMLKKQFEKAGITA